MLVALMLICLNDGDLQTQVPMKKYRNNTIGEINSKLYKQYLKKSIISIN